MHTYLSQDMPAVYLHEEQVASTGNRICTKQIFPSTNERKLIGETGYRVCRLPNQWESWPLTTGAIKIHHVDTCIFTKLVYLPPTFTLHGKINVNRNCLSILVDSTLPTLNKSINILVLPKMLYIDKRTLMKMLIQRCLKGTWSL